MMENIVLVKFKRIDIFVAILIVYLVGFSNFNNNNNNIIIVSFAGKACGEGEGAEHFSE